METTLNQRLGAVFRESGFKQVELARLAGVSKQTVNGWLHGRVVNIRPPNLIAVCDALSINVRWLATGRGPKSNRHLTETHARLPEALKNLDIAESQSLSESFINIAETRAKYGSQVFFA